MEVSNRPRQTKRLSLRKKVLFSVLTTVLFFVLVEGSLTLLGLERKTDTQDPFVGFSGLLPLMERSTDSQGNTILTTAPNKRHWFNEQTFPLIKKPGTKRVFCMGGSTTYGHPYWDSTSFPGWLREFLPVVDASQSWEVINAGGISYASYRVATLMEELAQYDPDLFIVYSVHNEFLERRTYQDMFEKPSFVVRTQAVLSRTRTWELADRIFHRFRDSAKPAILPEPTLDKSIEVLKGEVDEILNHTIGPVDYHRDDAWQAQVLHHYESNLRRMVSIARRAGAKIVFITPASNEKNCSPFKTELDPNIGPTEQNRLQELVGQINGDALDENSLETKQILEEALRIDPRNANLCYQLGQNHFANDLYAQAQRAFSRALNEDVCPLRAIDGIGLAVARIVEELNVPIVDFEKKLRRACEIENGHAIFGEEYFLDHVHPTVDVNRRLALWILEALQANKLVHGRGVRDALLADELVAIEDKVLSQIDRESQALALRNLAKVLHWSGKFDEAILRARDVLEILPNELEGRYVLASCLNNIGKKTEALDEYAKLFANGLDYPRAYLPYGELLAESGHLEQAKAYFLMAILHQPKNAEAYCSLGIVHLQLDEFPFAVESLEESNRLVADNLKTYFYLAQAKAGCGKTSEAIQLYEKILSRGVLSAELCYRYGLALLAEDRRADAIGQLERAIAMAPEWESVRRELEAMSKTPNE